MVCAWPRRSPTGPRLVLGALLRPAVGVQQRLDRCEECALRSAVGLDRSEVGLAAVRVGAHVTLLEDEQRAQARSILEAAGLKL